MKRILGLLIFAACLAVPAHAQLAINWTWTSPGAASSITTNPTTGAETAGPITSAVYHIPAVNTSGVFSCPAFSSTTWTLVSGPNGVAVTSAAANAGSLHDTAVTVGQVYCGAITDAFAAGGPPSAALVTTPVIVIIIGNALPPTSGAGTVGVA